MQKIAQEILSIDNRIRWFAVLNKEKIRIDFEKYADGIKPLTPNPHARRALHERLETSLRESYNKERYGEIKYILKSYENIDILTYPAGRYVFMITSKPQVLCEIIPKIIQNFNNLKEMLEVDYW